MIDREQLASVIDEMSMDDLRFVLAGFALNAAKNGIEEFRRENPETIVSGHPAVLWDYAKDILVDILSQHEFKEEVYDKVYQTYCLNEYFRM